MIPSGLWPLALAAVPAFSLKLTICLYIGSQPNPQGKFHRDTAVLATDTINYLQRTKNTKEHIEEQPDLNIMKNIQIIN